MDFFLALLSTKIFAHRYIFSRFCLMNWGPHGLWPFCFCVIFFRHDLGSPMGSGPMEFHIFFLLDFPWIRVYLSLIFLSHVTCHPITKLQLAQARLALVPLWWRRIKLCLPYYIQFQVYLSYHIQIKLPNVRHMDRLTLMRERRFPIRKKKDGLEKCFVKSRIGL